MTHPNRVRMSKLTLGLLAVLAAAPAFAQSTSAGVGGIVVDAGGRPVAGAEVTIVHTESGTVSRVTTDANGRYAARGLRVGGPYRVTIAKPGAGSRTESGIYLNLDKVSEINTKLDGDAQTLADVVVVGARASDVFSPDRMGAGTTVSRDKLEGFSSINRDLQDYARLDPRFAQTDKERGEVSVGGQNTRYNSITIDRVSTNDTFGLEANNLPTNRQPISIDAIQEVQVNVSNYDVTQKGYTGANINAVTKSGTNDLHGSAYYVYREADWVGKGANNRPFTGFAKDFTYGATLGGPILKDRLFFFANYEKSELTGPGGDSGPVGSGASNIVGNISMADVTRIQQIAQGYGLNAGNSGASSGTSTTSENGLVKLDWNISESQRASFRVNRSKQDEAILPGFSPRSFSLSSHWYNQQKEFTNYVGEWFADWSDRFSTEATLTYRDYHSEPRTAGAQPQVQVNFAGGQSVRFGTEQYRHANVLDTKTFGGIFAGTWFAGDHELKFGTDFERNSVYNLFVESRYGAYTFNSLTDFQNGRYRDYALRVPTSGNINDAAAQAKFGNVGLFVQDTWRPTANLTMQFGVRYDTLSVNERPVYNAAASNTFGYRNDQTVDGKSLLQPRFGFNYTFDSDRPTQLRGGIGLFQGAAANVWLVNPYTNNGQAISVFGCGSGFSNSCTAAPFTPNTPPRIGTARADVDFLHPDLEQPSVWKANLAFDHELPWWNIVAGIEATLFSVEKGIYYQHLNLGAPTRYGQDGRQLYWRTTAPTAFTSSGFFNGVSRANANTGYRDVLLAAPTGKGEGQNLTVSLERPMGRKDNWGWSLAYSYTNATDVNPLTSSRSVSNWNSRAAFNPNENVSGGSNYAIKDRFTGTLRFREQFFGANDTEFSLFYEGRSGKPYSWTYQNDMNGDGSAGNDLMYIPKGPGDVLFRGGAAEEAEFWSFVSQNPDLFARRGMATERSGSRGPWVNTFDMRVRQELPGFMKGHQSELVLDILNVGNLINKNWGQVEEIFFQSNGGQARSFVNFAGIDPTTGKYIYSLTRNSSGVFTPEGFGLRDRRGESRWAAQVTFRYKF